ncbi:MAG: virginiamycin lyase [Solirubrobacterales bacterium]|nr:virginiamycin lyase [Solirubrobacterales bacterium]
MTLTPRRGPGRLLRRFLAALACLALGLVAGDAVPAGAAVYWGNGGTLGAANLDGSNPQPKFFKPPFPADSALPSCGVAASPTYLYWTGAFGLGRVNLEGPAAPTTIVPRIIRPCGIAIDGEYVYWANLETGTIGRAGLDGSQVNEALVGGLDHPCNVAVDDSHVYWVDLAGVGRAGLDGSDPEPRWIPSVHWGCGLAVDAQHVYWAGDGSVGRANLDGSDPEPGFITGLGSIAAIATGPRYVYWTDSPEGMAYSSIGRANIDGSGAVRIWNATQQVQHGGLAVDGRPSPPPLPLPSRPIHFGKLRHDKHTGVAVLDVWVPERGELTVTGPKLGWKVLAPPPPYRGASFGWRLKLWPGKGAVGNRIRTQLRNRRRAPLTLRVSYSEEGQLPFTTVKRMTLLKTGR